MGYFLPGNLGGFYGQFMFAADEGVTGTRHTGGRLGYQSGPLNVATAYGRTAAGANDYTTATVGGSYDFGIVKAYANYLQHKLGSDKRAFMKGLCAAQITPGTHVYAALRDDIFG